jgi:hypothetical protein
MAAATQQRSFRILARPANGKPGRLRLTIDGETTDYLFSLMEGDGETFSLVVTWRQDHQRDAYHVCVRHDGDCECDCWGWLRHGHCKHAAVTVPLLQSL